MKIHPEIAAEYVDALAMSGNELVARRQIWELAQAESKVFLSHIAPLNDREIIGKIKSLLAQENRLLKTLERMRRAKRPNCAKIDEKYAEAKALLAELNSLQRAID